jgi:hypothetical protein
MAKGHGPMNKENFIEILSESAIRRYGEEEAQSLSPAIQETAAWLAGVDSYEIEMEEEPGFYLR